MRILELRFKNLNSLKGEWLIDFSDEAFVNEGIFAITGQTGAGKTTILDAICLALYAETPRINSISKSTNEVMTQQTGDCYAEVVIDLNGSHYRCRWGQRRAYNKPDGKLQDATHEVALVKSPTDTVTIPHSTDAKMGDEILESKLSRTKDKIIELTHMDFQQFTRSILLAQGSFAAFLTAKSDERADILEKITGTDIYATVSKLVFERHRNEKNALGELTAQLSGVQLLSPEAISELQATLKQQAQEQQQYRQKLTTLTEQIQSLTRIQTLKQQRQDNEQKLTQAQQQLSDFAPQTLRLEQANKALEIAEQFSDLYTKRQNYQRLSQEQQQLNEQLPLQQQQQTLAKQALSASESAEQIAKNELERQRPHIEQARQLDAQIAQYEQSLTDKQQHQTHLKTRQQTLAASLEQAHQQQSTTTQELVNINDYLTKHSHLQRLGDDLHNFNHAIHSIDNLFNNNADHHHQKVAEKQQQQQLEAQRQTKNEQYEQIKAGVETQRQKIQHLQHQLAKISGNQSLSHLHQRYEVMGQRQHQLDKLQSHLDKLAELYQQTQPLKQQLSTVQEHIEQQQKQLTSEQQYLEQLQDDKQQQQQQKQLLQKLINLEEQLEHYIELVKHNEPCPLCGSTSHPYLQYEQASQSGQKDNAETNEVNQLSHPLYNQVSSVEKSQLQQTEQRIAQLENDIQQQTEQLSQTRIALVREQDNLQHSTDNIHKLQQQITQSQQQIYQQITFIYHYNNELVNPIKNSPINDSRQQNEDVTHQSFYTLLLNFDIHLSDKAVIDSESVNSDGANNDYFLLPNDKLPAFINAIRTYQQHLTQQQDSIKQTLAQSNELNEQISLANEQYNKQQQTLGELSSAINHLDNQLQLSQQRFDNVNNQQAKNFTELQTLIKPVLALANQYQLTLDKKFAESISLSTPLLGEDITHCIDNLRQHFAQLSQRQQHHQQQINHQSQLEKSLAIISSQIEEQQKQQQQIEQEIQQVTTQINEVQQQLDKHRQQRENVFGDKDPTQEEQNLRHAIEQAVNQRNSHQQQYLSCEQQYQYNHDKLTQITEQLSKHRQALQDAEQSFNTALSQQGFANETVFLQARLPVEERQQLSRQQQLLSQAVQELTTLISQNKNELAQLESKPLIQSLNQSINQPLNQSLTQLLETLHTQQDELQQRYEALSKEMGANAQQLVDNQNRQQQHQALLQQIAEKRKDGLVWAQLNELIGSADGKRFRTFAQGLTFEIMLRHANGQLKKMSDRYLLTRDDNNPLELNVIDNYQGGEVRSSKNLSGGEGFIISLALALGLSQMASQNIRVDSLFLDEGFGTLDEDSLDIALDTLTGLQQEGKLIGVISHVQALKERIFTQIKVEKLSGGYSKISGMGCRKVGE